MKTESLAVILTLALAGAAQGAEPVGNIDSEAQAIMKNKCTGCHGEERIKAAFSAGKDMRAIQKEMQKRAKLTGSEQEVMGIYWKKKSPLK